MNDKSEAILMPLEDTDLDVAVGDVDVRGRRVIDSSGEEVGEIDGLLVDADERRVRFLRVGSGGFLGIGEKKVLIPVDAVVEVNTDTVVIDKEREQVAKGPSYDPELEELRGTHFYENLYGYYGYAPFWSPGYRYRGF